MGKVFKLARLGAALAVVGLVFAGPAFAAGAKIGALLPMTGDLQAYGPTSKKGIDLAARQVNEQGGILGGKLDIVLGDTQTNPQQAVDAAKRLVSVEGVAGIVGALSSGVTIPVAKSVTSKEGVPQVSSASTSPEITTLGDNDFLFRTVPTDAIQGKGLAQIAKGAGYGKLAVIYVNNAYGKGLADAFKMNYESMGGTVTGSAPYEKAKASYRGELKGLTDGDPEALVFIGYPESGVTILRQALEEGYFKKFVFTDGMNEPDWISKVGAEFVDGSIGSVPKAATETDSYKRFVEAYGGKPEKAFVDTAYDAAFLLALAIEKAGSMDGKAVRDALREVASAPGKKILPGQWKEAVAAIKAGEDIDYVGATGDHNFDKNGDVSGLIGHWMIKGGKLEDVETFDPANK